MYLPGEELFLFSNTLSSDGSTPLTPTKPVGFEMAPGLKPIYHVRIVHAYTPFTMAVVCRVRLIGVFESPMAIAPHIALPLDSEDNIISPSSLDPSSDDPGTPTDGPEYILKLYDRRCFENVREEYGCDEPYSEEDARAYEKYRAGAPAPYFTRDFCDMPGVSDEEDAEANTGLFEAWLEEYARKTYRRELAVYNLLRDLQGKSIPKLFDTVSCNIPFRFDRTGSLAGEVERKAQDMRSAEHEPESDNHMRSSGFVDWNTICGILIEYIPGASLRSFIHSCMLSPNHRLRSELVSIAEEAVAVTVEIGRRPVHNKDVRLDNMLVRDSYVSTLDFDLRCTGPSSTECTASAQTALPQEIQSKQSADSGAADPPIKSRCVAIDFGHARPRFPDESDEQWRCAKDFEDEEFLITSAIQWEMQVLFRELRTAHGATSEIAEEANSDKSLRRACLNDQQALWCYQRVHFWHRDLSPEEYEEYLKDSGWGQHPNSRD